jgi:hypothetical protein
VVTVAQLVERRIVIPVVEGSIPFSHPIFISGLSIPFGYLGQKCDADVVKLVYTPDLGSGAARRESSSLSIRTIYLMLLDKWCFKFKSYCINSLS